jgi:serine/threonine protein kinase
MAKQIGQYEIHRPLGEGQFGKVKEAVHIETGMRYAAKIIKKTAIKTKKDADTVKKEVTLMKQLNGHPNILNMFEVLEDAEKFYLILELAAGGDLFDKIIQMGGFSEDQARVYFQQIVSGLRHCHDKGIIHRDMKPENLLLDASGALKISDFGLSNVILTSEQMLKTHCGSEKYAAPEVMQNTDPYIGPPVDVWSIGVILYIMVAGAFPFVEATMNCELYASFVAGTFQFPKAMSDDLVDLLTRTFAAAPAQRITLAQIAEHPWVNPGAQLPAADEPSLDGYSGAMAIDEEPVYRTLDADIMSVDAAGFDEEPVYRSIAVDQLSSSDGAMSSCEKSCGMFPCHAEQFTVPVPPAEMLKKLSTLMEKEGFTVKVKEDRGQVKGEAICPSGITAKVKFLVQPGADGLTHVAMKRMKGCSLEYSAFAKKFCSAAFCC